MNFQKPLPPAPMLPSRGQTTESGFVPVTPSWLSYSATHTPKVLQNPRFYRQNDATATQHGGLFSQFCLCKYFSTYRYQFCWPFSVPISIEEVYPPVYLHLIFKISSVTQFFFNFKISSLKNWKINLISKLIFAGYTGSKNQVRAR